MDLSVSNSLKKQIYGFFNMEIFKEDNLWICQWANLRRSQFIDLPMSKSLKKPIMDLYNYDDGYKISGSVMVSKIRSRHRIVRAGPDYCWQRWNFDGGRPIGLTESFHFLLECLLFEFFVLWTSKKTGLIDPCFLSRRRKKKTSASRFFLVEGQVLVHVVGVQHLAGGDAGDEEEGQEEEEEEEGKEEGDEAPPQGREGPSHATVQRWALAVLRKTTFKKRKQDGAALSVLMTFNLVI